ncbi:MAG: hydrolase 1, exosortase A system-associated [Rubrivivax sp.]|jgi:exosortase A-associated hydrolase 1|nr:hydrolase 1, exosortase A system-associated [Rubrivivax sp.]
MNLADAPQRPGSHQEGTGAWPITEVARLMPCAGDSLVGVLAQVANVADVAQAAAPRRTGVVLVVGGPQVRTGSHRQFTQMARALAAAGWPSLRFDVRGMGDSTGAARGFETLDDDLHAAVLDLRQARPELDRIVLFGLCDAASAALLWLQRQPETTRALGVRALVLLNPWVRSAQTQAAAQVRHYYVDRLRDPAFWKKLLAGGVALGAVAGLWRSVRTILGTGSRSAVADAPSGYVERMAAAWQSFDAPLLLVLSGQDYTAREFEEAVRSQSAWAGALLRKNVTVCQAPAADHTFSDLAEAAALEQTVLAWLQRHCN